MTLSHDSTINILLGRCITCSLCATFVRNFARKIHRLFHGCAFVYVRPYMLCTDLLESDIDVVGQTAGIIAGVPARATCETPVIPHR